MERIYIQAKVREGRVPLSSKIFQGFGSMSDSHIQFAFNALLMIYYNQLLGVSGTAVSLALAAALVIDAISDPLVGAFSDRLDSRFGRRHLLMYLSALPLGIMMFLLLRASSSCPRPAAHEQTSNEWHTQRAKEHGARPRAADARLRAEAGRRRDEHELFCCASARAGRGARRGQSQGQEAAQGLGRDASLATGGPAARARRSC